MATIFKLKDNVPEIYVKESRDFQLLCNIFDVMNLSVKEDIDSMPNILDTRLCKDSMLPLLQTKLGFFTSYNLTNNETRHILSAFKHLVKDKGSSIGIREAIEIYLKLLNLHKGYRINIINSDATEFEVNGIKHTKSNNVYLVIIEMETKPTNLDVLKSMLEYILPTGYKLGFGFYTSKNFNTNMSLEENENTIKICLIDSEKNNAVVNSTTAEQAGKVSTTHTLLEGGTSI